MKALKYVVIAFLVIVVIISYNTPIIKTWRFYNNGLNKYKRSKLEEASKCFKKASLISNNPIFSYNWIVIESKILHKSFCKVEEERLFETSDSTKLFQLRQNVFVYQDFLDSLLMVEDIPDSLKPKSLFLKGKLSLVMKDTSRAIASFSNAVEEQSNFKPALYELVKLNNKNSENQINYLVRKLLLSISDIEKVDIVKNYKPF